MSEPIKANDLCEVIGGLGRGKSPNIGKRVIAVTMQGEHSQWGRVWRCAGEGIVQLGDAGNYVVVGWADFPTAWLRKIEPPKLSTKTETQKTVDV
jgi:hypothetical protein